MMKHSKTHLFLPLAVVLVAAGWWCARQVKPVVPPAAPVVTVPEGQVLERQTEATEVFKRAFWRRPTAEDRIVHGERREWSDGDGVARWQWFLEVEPSEALRRDLLETNRFALKKVPAARLAVRERPAWFLADPDGYEALAADGGAMLILFQPGDGRLFATGSGGGFVRASGAPAVPSQPAAPPIAGRLPNRPPPTPEAP